MKKIQLLLAAHCHQPVGNFEFVFEDNYRKAYRPFADALLRHPGVRWSLHYSGPLLEWLQAKHPEFLKLLQQLSDRGQIEFWTGGFYEPILSVIPPDDAVGQTRMMSRAVAQQFGVRPPEGLWLTERVWEPSLPSLVRRVEGVRFTAVDDTQFRAAGCDEADLHEAWVTEDLGWTLSLFPISKKMRYLVPFRPVEEVIEHLRGLGTDEGDRAAILADDGEKFGGWPDTHDWVYRRGWLENFFTAIEQNADWLTTTKFGDFLRDHPAKRRVYLPTGSYEELEEWALPPGKQKALEILRTERPDAAGFVRGGYWRNFLSRYPEANRLHKKMVWVSKKVARATGQAEFSDPASPPPMVRELWRGQCNCPYWHGVFGGLYLNYLRHAVYGSLLKAETAADRIVRGDGPWADAVRTDWNGDGEDEVVLESDLLCAVIDPVGDGGIVELDWRPTAMNLGDTLTRRPEAYHEKLRQAAASGHTSEVASIHDRVKTKEPGLEHRLAYDAWTRSSGTAAFLPAGASRDDVVAGRAGGVPLRAAKGSDVTAGVSMEGEIHRASAAWTAGPVQISVALDRAVVGASLKATYRVSGSAPEGSDRFSVEWNLSLLAGNASDRFVQVNGSKADPPHLAGEAAHSAVTSVALVDEWQKIRCTVSTDRPAELWRYPVETVSLSEDGFERVFQQTALRFVWSLEDAAQSPVVIRLTVEPIP